MARAQPALQGGRLPGEQVAVGADAGAGSPGMGVGEADGRHPEDVLGGDGRPQVTRCHRLAAAGPRLAHGGDHRVGGYRIGGHPSHPPPQAVLVQGAQFGAPDGPQRELVTGGADEKWHLGCRAGGHCLLGCSIQQAPVDHRHHRQTRVVDLPLLAELVQGPHQFLGRDLLQRGAGECDAEVGRHLLCM